MELAVQRGDRRLRKLYLLIHGRWPLHRVRPYTLPGVAGNPRKSDRHLICDAVSGGRSFNKLPTHDGSEWWLVWTTMFDTHISEQNAVFCSLKILRVDPSLSQLVTHFEFQGSDSSGIGCPSLAASQRHHRRETTQRPRAIGSQKTTSAHNDQCRYWIAIAMQASPHKKVTKWAMTK